MIAFFRAVMIACLVFFMSFIVLGEVLGENLKKPRSPNDYLYDQYRWSIMYYYGISASDGLTRILTGSFHRWPEHLHSIELTYTLPEDNFVREVVSSLVGVVQLAGNFSLRSGSKQTLIKEFDPYLIFRWTHFPWEDYLVSSFAIGEGISYVTSVPSLEKKDNNNTKRLLNYLMLQATFASPEHPRLQWVTRIHHRSGAYGLYHAGNTGSNNVGLGVRYLFD